VKLAVLVLALGLAAPAGAAPDDPLARARDDFAALNYDDAVRVVDAAWHAGGNDPETLRQMFAIAGQAAGSTGDKEAARLWFTRWLSLDPDAELPAGTSPKLTALLGEAHVALDGAHLTARAIARHDRVEVEVTSDPLALATAARGDGKRVHLDHGHAIVSADDSTKVELLDRYGNVLARLEIERELPRGPETPPIEHPTPVGHWTMWAYAAGGLAVIGGGALYVAYDARSQIETLNAHSSMHEYTAAESLQTRFDRAQWTSRIAFGGALAAAVVSAMAWRFEF
jgi:hypothetical protein